MKDYKIVKKELREYKDSKGKELWAWRIDVEVNLPKPYSKLIIIQPVESKEKSSIKGLVMAYIKHEIEEEIKKVKEKQLK